MKKLKLKTEYNYDFQLYGIMSGVKEYSLSWSINHLSTIELTKQDDLPIAIKGVGEIQVSNYRYNTDTLNIYLVRNFLDQSKKIDQKLFIPSLSHFDYILKIEAEDDLSFLDEFFLAIRKSNQVQSIVKLDVNKIKEKEYFLF